MTARREEGWKNGFCLFFSVKHYYSIIQSCQEQKKTVQHNRIYQGGED